MGKVHEINFKEFPFLNRLASYNIFGNKSDAVNTTQSGYSIRIFVSIGLKSEWEYFSLDKTGLIIGSPRGLAKKFNKKVRIVDMEDMLKEYAGKTINQF